MSVCLGVHVHFCSSRSSRVTKHIKMGLSLIPAWQLAANSQKTTKISAPAKNRGNTWTHVHIWVQHMHETHYEDITASTTWQTACQDHVRYLGWTYLPLCLCQTYTQTSRHTHKQAQCNELQLYAHTQTQTHTGMCIHVCMRTTTEHYNNHKNAEHRHPIFRITRWLCTSVRFALPGRTQHAHTA